MMIPADSGYAIGAARVDIIRARNGCGVIRQNEGGKLMLLVLEQNVFFYTGCGSFSLHSPTRM